MIIIGISIFAFVVVVESIVIFSFITYSRYSVNRAKTQRAMADIKSLTQAAEIFHIENGFWPKTLNELVSPPEGDTAPPPRPVLDDLPIDPWGNSYDYSYSIEENKDKLRIRSAGPDGELGTSDDIQGNGKYR